MNCISEIENILKTSTPTASNANSYSIVTIILRFANRLIDRSIS